MAIVKMCVLWLRIGGVGIADSVKSFFAPLFTTKAKGQVSVWLCTSV